MLTNLQSTYAYPSARAVDYPNESCIADKGFEVIMHALVKMGIRNLRLPHGCVDVCALPHAAYFNIAETGIYLLI
ncbi:hypothetical protein TRAPUB_2724 [Trametes pubescens]|uniref:Uncharacterized protein n=1 Tax=Trametes pubescens TaxID=154538 RepID=A0A1M2VFR0_TRAPU|nr:hypothetical protein TRAPUB_2724 [Trametes pubescens]